MQVEVNGYQMVYEENGKGLPLVLIHGYPLNRRLWTPQLAGLADSARVLALDLRGHGASNPVKGPYSMDLFAQDVNAFLDAVHIQEPIVLAGLSMGGYVALAFFRQFASRLAGLILTATKAGPDLAQAKAGREQAAAVAQEKGVAAIAESMLPKMMAPTTYEQRPDRVERVREIMLETTLEGVLGDLAGMKARPDSEPMLSQIRIPALVIHGADDALIPVQEAKKMAAALPQAQLEIIPNAGHLPNLEQPDRYNAVVRSFLQSLPSKQA